jgi:hypothetical protein
VDKDLTVAYVEGKGRGVFAARAFRRGSVVERAPVLFVFNGFCALGDKEELSQYELAWGRKKVAIACGLVHLYNHSDTPNVVFERDLLRGVITVRAVRNIKAGAELCHKYACEPWFSVRG